MEMVLQDFDITKMSQLSANESGLACPTIEDDCLKVVGWEDDVIQIGKIMYPCHYSFTQAQPKLWGLFTGLRIDDADIKEARESLFPDRF